MPNIIKKLKLIFIPKSLWSRFFLIIILPAILIQVITAHLFYSRHWEDVSFYMKDSIIGDISFLEQLILDKIYSIDEISNYAEKALRIKIHQKYQPFEHEARFNEIADLLKENLDGKYDIKILQPLHKANIFVNLKAISNHDNIIDDITIEIPRKRLHTPTTTIFIAWMFSVSTIFIIVSLLFTKRQIKAIVKLAEAAQAFGQGNDIKDFKPEGASEVRKAGYAFLDMKDKIEEQINQKTQTLAGLSHDLKTPLTRIKLAIAMLPENEELKEIGNDIDEMQNMIHTYLQFVKRNDFEAFKQIDFIKFIRSIIYKFQSQGCNVILNTNIKSYLLSIKPVQLRRAIGNVIENGLRYGSLVEVFITQNGPNLSLIIEDNGPGIPEEEHEKIFSAFYRSDYARNLKSHSGAGLGLAITRDIINSHGGTIKVKKNNIKHKGGSIEIIFKIL